MNDVATFARTAERSGSDERVSGLLEATLADARATRSGEPGFREGERALATAFLETRGFPSPNDEAWRFTPMRAVLRVPYARRPPPSAATEDARDGQIVLVNGSAVDIGSATLGLEVRRLSDALRAEPELLEPYLGRIARIEHGFVAQNAALFDDGLLIVARAGAQVRVNVVHLAVPGAEPTLSTPRVLVVAEAGSELLLVESHESREGAPHFENSVTEIAVGENAKVEHVRVHHGSAHAASVGTIAVRQARDSRYASRIFTFGGSLTRLELQVTFDDKGGDCTLHGLYLARDGELVDHHTVIDHAKPHCSSRERYKGILDGNGVAVFDGTVFVRRGADRTEAHQENRNLLLSNDAAVHTKPHLEIDTDDVKCSHGATVGKLDPAQLFYLRARGMPEAVARSLLTYAFAREMAASVADEALREMIESAIAAFLPDGAAARELA